MYQRSCPDWLQVREQAVFEEHGDGKISGGGEVKQIDAKMTSGLSSCQWLWINQMKDTVMDFGWLWLKLVNKVLCQKKQTNNHYPSKRLTGLSGLFTPRVLHRCGHGHACGGKQGQTQHHDQRRGRQGGDNEHQHLQDHRNLLYAGGGIWRDHCRWQESEGKWWRSAQSWRRTVQGFFFSFFCKIRQQKWTTSVGNHC